MSKRERNRRARIRRDPAGRLALTVGDYLKSKGWYILMTTGATVEQLPTEPKNRFRFVVGFIGRAPKTAEKA